MTKKQLDQCEDMHEDFDLSELAYPDDSMTDVMSTVLDTGNHQMTIALELTKLIVASNPSEKNNTAEHIFATFQQAVGVVGESFTLQHVMAEIEQ